MVFPEAMDTKRHDVVHAVVGGGDGGENIMDFFKYRGGGLKSVLRGTVKRTEGKR